MAKRPGKHRQAHVVAAWLRGPTVDGPFQDSIMDVIDYDNLHHRYLDRENGGGRIAMQSSPRIAEARSQVVETFLKSFPKAEWLWWVDSDAAFDAETLAALMAVADAKEKPIVGALAFGGSRPGNMFPTLYSMHRDEDGEIEVERATDYPRDALVKVAGTGCHCVLIHRRVFTAMQTAYGTLPNGKPNIYPWYVESHVDRNGQPLGEDVIFCMRAAGLGIPTHVHTAIKTGHVKQIILDEELWDAEKAERDKVVPIRKEIIL